MEIVCVCNILTYLLCLTALSSLIMAMTHYLSISKRGCMFPPLNYTWNTKGFDAHIVVCAPAAPSQRLQLHVPALLLFSDSTEHHQQASFSPNITDNTGEAAPFCLSFLLLKKNSLVALCNCRPMIAAEKSKMCILSVRVRCTGDMYSMWLGWSAGHFELNQS